MATPALAARDLTLARDGQSILDGLTLEIDPGTDLLIQGQSGAGKTTLFNVLGLLEPPSSGRLVVEGTDASSLSETRRAKLRRDHLGIVFQDFQLVPDLTARENAALPQEHAGERDEAWLDELFGRLGLDGLEDQHPATLSGGEKQRVAIARALANRPAVVLADEPTGQLDPETAERVLELLFRLHEETGTALVVVSHDRSVQGQFSEIVRLRDGRLDR
jgi:putative ABC transport system ATP-binding protein